MENARPGRTKKWWRIGEVCDEDIIRAVDAAELAVLVDMKEDEEERRQEANTTTLPLLLLESRRCGGVHSFVYRDPYATL